MQLHLYGLAAKDSTGKIKDWDTTITLEIGATGKPTGNAWGKTLFDSGVTFGPCFNDPEMLSARQVGDTLTLVNYGFDKVFDCQISPLRQP